jgi:hypothetical protein
VVRERNKNMLRRNADLPHWGVEGVEDGKKGTGRILFKTQILRYEAVLRSSG